MIFFFSVRCAHEIPLKHNSTSTLFASSCFEVLTQPNNKVLFLRLLIFLLSSIRNFKPSWHQQEAKREKKTIHSQSTFWRRWCWLYPLFCRIYNGTGCARVLPLAWLQCQSLIWISSYVNLSLRYFREMIFSVMLFMWKGKEDQERCGVNIPLSYPWQSAQINGLCVLIGVWVFWRMPCGI